MKEVKKTKSRAISLLRALAIISVIIFHVSVKALPGGFLGVDLFFVMSGYLTMSSFYDKYKGRRAVSVKDYIVKKFKKLSPTLYTMIIAVLVYLVLFNKPALESSNFDGLAGLTFTSNIWYIVKKADYFDTFAIKPFNHLWYLGVQVQLYLLIIILLKIFGINKEKRIDNFTKVVFVLFVASYVAHIALFDMDNINRIYYGTDTRAFEFLGGVLAARLLPIRYVEWKSRFFRTFKGVISIASIALFIVLTKLVSQYSFWIYQGGFMLIVLLCLVMIYSTSAAIRKNLNKIIDKTPFNFIGDISYDLYIWHYPIVVLSLGANELDQVNVWLTIARMVGVLVVSLLVNEFIVSSIDRYTVSGSINRLYNKFIKKSVWSQRVIAFFLVILLGLTGMGLAGLAVPYLSTAFVEEKKEINIGDSFKTEKENDDDSLGVQSTDTPNKRNKKDKIELSELIIGKANAKTGYIEIDNPKKDPTKMTLLENIEEMPYSQLVVIGDSLAVNVGPAIKEAYPDTVADGKISRQLYNSASLVSQYSNYDSEDTAFIFLLGTNGAFMEKHMDELLAPLKKSDIYFINIKVPGVHEKQVNEALKDYSQKNSARVDIIDWNSLSTKHPEYLEPDKTHLNKTGVNAIVKLIFEKLSSK